MTTSGDFQLSTLEWLLDHHAVKYLDRRRMVDDLGLRPGDVVLDLGCGPGLWTPMFAEKVAPGGNVVGFDISKDLTDYAVLRLADHPLSGSMRFKVGNFEATPFDDGAFDAVFLGNCCCYASDFSTVLREAKRVSRGRVFSKDFDGGTVIYHPPSPLGEAAKRYVTENARWLGAMAAPHLSDEDRERWSNAFDPVSGVLDREDFYFCMVEMITRGNV